MRFFWRMAQLPGPVPQGRDAQPARRLRTSLPVRTRGGCLAHDDRWWSAAVATRDVGFGITLRTSPPSPGKLGRPLVSRERAFGINGLIHQRHYLRIRKPSHAAHNSMPRHRCRPAIDDVISHHARDCVARDPRVATAIETAPVGVPAITPGTMPCPPPRPCNHLGHHTPNPPTPHRGRSRCRTRSLPPAAGYVKLRRSKPAMRAASSR
jgi:hypothetical protein